MEYENVILHSKGVPSQEERQMLLANGGGDTLRTERSVQNKIN